MGLVSALFPSADDIQHGNLARIGDFLAALVASPPAEMHLVLDGKQEIRTHGSRGAGLQYALHRPALSRLAPPTSFNDGLLDVLLFADLSKLDLLGYAVQGVRRGAGRKTHASSTTSVRRVDIDTQPAMPVMVDGLALGEGPLRIRCGGTPWR